MPWANDSANSFRVGDFLANAAYLGDDLVWSPKPPEFTIEGASFEPSLELRAGSTADIQWTDPSGSTVYATGTQPVMTFPDATPRQVVLRCSNPADIYTLNLGFHNEQDYSLDYSPSSGYNHPTQPVTAINNLQTLVGLRRFMAARTNGVSSDMLLYTGPVLGGALNFSGMTNIEHIECFGANIQSAVLSGCDSLIRLVFEMTQVATLDLNPVRNTLCDLRAAAQQDETLTLTPLEGPMSALSHFCTRRQTLAGMPDVETMFPAIQQLWIWECGINQDIVVRSNRALHSVILSSVDTSGLSDTNVHSHLDLAGQTFAGLSNGRPRVEAFGVGMQTVNLTGMGPVGQIELHNNLLDEASVDHVLSVVDSWGTSDGDLYLDGSNSPPTQAGADFAASLQSRGWVVRYNPPTTPGALLWSDEFARADASGWANVGNGWLQPIGGSDISVSNENIVLSGGSSYQRVINVPAALAGITNYHVEIELDGTQTSTSWYGLLARMDASGNGAKVLFSSSGVPRGDEGNTSAGNDLGLEPGGIPASWTQPGVHLMRARFIGSRVDLYLDDVYVGGRSASTQYGPGSGVGFCGTSPHTYRAIRVYSI